MHGLFDKGIGERANMTMEESLGRELLKEDGAQVEEAAPREENIGDEMSRPI